MNAKGILIGTLLLAMLASLSPAQLFVSVSPQSSAYLDVNQTVVNFTASTIGGTGPYSYQWSTAAGAYCPGLYKIPYRYQSQVLRYTPNSTGSNCVLSVQVTDYYGVSGSATTGNIASNPAMTGSTTLNQSAYTINQGQNATISLPQPTGGTPPYHFQWLASTSISGRINASNANSLCTLTYNSQNCVFHTSSYTNPTVYSFELSYWDSATVPTSIVTKPILIRVGGSTPPATTSTNPTSTAPATTSLVSSTSSSSSSTTIAQSTPMTPLIHSIDIVTDTGSRLVKWLKQVLSHII